VAAVGGTAVAGSPVTTAAKTKHKKKSTHSDRKADAKLFNSLLKSKGPKLTVANAAKAKSADTATHANSADTATSAQPSAFALIDGPAATVSRAKGVTNANVTHPAAGTYCVSGLAFTVQGAQVTPQFEGSGGTSGQFTAGTTGFCPKGGQVLIWNAAGTTKVDETFNIVLYG
jgi:hypothetical protein